jgi:hypothetical protein
MPIHLIGKRSLDFFEVGACVGIRIAYSEEQMTIVKISVAEIAES